MITNKEKKVLAKLGDKIRILREEKNLSQFQLANEAEIPKNQIGRIERAEINTTLLTLNKIAFVLDVKISKLLE